MSRIIRRILVIIPAVALEVLWILALLTWLRPWAGLIETSLSVLSVVFVFYIIMKQDEGTYKILWLIIILFSPIVGALLYLLFGNKRDIAFFLSGLKTLFLDKIFFKFHILRI